MSEKERILSKFNIKDYRNELELILEGKNFDEEAQSLILSIFYKLDNFYKDYVMVKKESEAKNKFIEEYINIIKLKCNKISILSPQECTKNHKYTVDKQKGEIECFPNENILLYAIYELNEEFETDEKYGLKDFLNMCVNHLLTKGNTINSTEPIRDFNGWSWNYEIGNTENIIYNLIFQNMLILFGHEFIFNNLNNPNIMDVLKNNSKEFGESGHEFLECLFEISIDMYNNLSKENHDKCLKYKNAIRKKVDLLKNRKEYINNKSKNSANIIKKIQKIDIVLNDVNLTQKVFQKNLKAGKIKCYTISDFIDIIEKKRNKLLKKIDDNNKLLSPKEYLKNFEEYKDILELFDSIKEKNDKINIQNKLVKLQNLFLKCEKLKIIKEENKKNLYNLANELRYYANIPYSKNKKVISQEKLMTEFEETSKALIYKMVENKVIDIGLRTKKLNYDVLKYMFKTQIIKLDNLAVKIKFLSDSKIEVEYYDANVIERKEIFEIPPDEKNINKKEKKVKIFKIGG